MLEIIFNNTNTTLHGSRALMMQLRAVNPIFYWDEQVLQAERAWRHCTLHTQFFYKAQQDRFTSGVIPLPPENFHLGKLVLEESSVLQLFTWGQFFFCFPYSTSPSWSSFSSDQQDTTRSTLSSPSKKDNINLPSVEKNQRWAGHHDTDLINRPCMEVVLAGISPNSPFPCGLELPHFSTHAGDLSCIPGWFEPDQEPHTILMWLP